MNYLSDWRYQPMNKTELMETYTAEQLADKVIKLETIIDDKLGGWSKHRISYNELFTMRDKIEELKSEVEKYRKAFEDEKKERDCQIAEYQNRVDKDKTELERAKNTINQIDDILEKLFGVRHDTIDKPNEFEDVLRDKICEKVEYFISERPIEVADVLIKETGKSCLDKYSISDLRQIAEHLLVYCNHNGESGE